MVSVLGLGAGQLGDPTLDEAAVGRLLNGAVDAGITLIDTARGYGASEERIGRHLGPRRHELVLSTKVGYGIPGTEDWTAPCIRAGIDEALRLLRTDWIDVVHLHSCPLWILERGEVIEALAQAVAAGKVRVAAYSGDNQPLDWAVASGRFGSVQVSISAFDQRVIPSGLAAAAARGLGVIAKRPLGNAPWRFPTQPHGDYCEPYWQRMRAMTPALDQRLGPGAWSFAELALRFTASLPGVSSCIVGSRRLEHVLDAAAQLARGPLPDPVVAALRAAFTEADDSWIGQT